MAVEVEFGSKDAADAVRSEFGEWLCSDDDRRLKTVTFSSDIPEGVLGRIRSKAQESRALDRQRSQTAKLSEEDRERIKEAGGFQGPATVFSWESAKGVFQREGEMGYWRDAIPAVADHEDPIEGAEEWIRNYRSSGGGFGTKEDRGEEDIRQARRAEEAAKKAQGGQCNHAKGHCEHGDAEACEFLKQACGYNEEEVDRLLSTSTADAKPDTDQQQLVTVGGGDFPEMQVSPEQAGALNRSWQGYKGAVNRLERRLKDVRESVIDARQAMQAINAIRSEHGQDELHPDRLHDLLEALGDMPADIPEVRTLDHYRDFAGADQAEVEAAASEVIEQDPQRDLTGQRTDPQARFAGGERGERGQGEIEAEARAERNPGGVMADQREGGLPGEGETEHDVPEEFQTAEGGQDTL